MVLRILLMPLWTSPSSWAQEPPPTDATPTQADDADLNRAEAKRLFDVGVQLYEEGQYGPAIEAFQRAYDLTEHPELLFNMANAQERHGDLEGAIRSLDRYRLDAEPDEREVLSRRILSLEARVKAAETAAAAAAAPPTTTPPPPLATPTRSGPRWAIVSAGALTFATFGATSAVTYGASRRFLRNEDQESYETVRPVNNVSLALAGLGLVTTTVGLTWRKRPSDGTASVRLGPNGIVANF
ncbi:MAG: tetratricopeptide repeat protein [Myxococcales bacterium]|nr:tetratricopeptide repeat protein [Myxococcales bacterium]